MGEQLIDMQNKYTHKVVCETCKKHVEVNGEFIARFQSNQHIYNTGHHTYVEEL